MRDIEHTRISGKESVSGRIRVKVRTILQLALRESECPNPNQYSKTTKCIKFDNFIGCICIAVNKDTFILVTGSTTLCFSQVHVYFLYRGMGVHVRSGQ